MQMSFTTVIIAVFMPFACIAAATALMRLFDVKEVTAEQAQAEAEKLLAQPTSKDTPPCSGRSPK
jgi:hypothetical protein